MTKFTLGCVLVVLVAIGSIEAGYPSKYKFRKLSTRSIEDELPGQLASTSELKELPPKELPKDSSKEVVVEKIVEEKKDVKGYPKELKGPDALDGPKDLKGPGMYGPEGFPKGPEGLEPRSGPGPYGGPQGGPEGGMFGGMFGGPEGPNGPEGGKPGPYNPFRSSKPSYREYLHRMKPRRFGRYGPPPPMGPYGPQAHLPMYTEVIIIRKVPIMLSKLLVIAATNADKLKSNYKPDGKLPYPPPEPQTDVGKKPKFPGLDDITLQADQPSLEFTKRQFRNGADPFYSKGKEAEKVKEVKEEKEFQDAMGVEENVPMPKAYPFQGEKNLKPEREGKSLEEGPKKDVKLKFEDKEYLEKPDAFGGNDLGEKKGEKKLEDNELKA